NLPTIAVGIKSLLDEFANKHVAENTKSSEEETNAARKNADALIIEEWVLDNEEENVSQPRIEKKTVMPNIVRKECVKLRQQENTARKTVKKVKQPRTSTLSFIRPFGCLVTILNTIDHLRKFDGKADEGTQSNGFAGTKASDNAGQAKKETEPINDYILLPLWTANLPFSQNPKSSQDDGFKPLLMIEKSLTVNVADTNGVNDVGELPFDPDMLALEDVGTFDFSNKDEDDDVVADMNNLDITIQVSPTTTIRIHKDHPLDQVIRDLQSVTQTRNMTKNLKERRNKKDERGIMIRNKARLVAQGHTQEEGNDYNEVFVPVPRIEAIRLFLAYASFKYFMVYQMDVKVLFSMGRLKKMCMYVNHQNLKIQTFLIEYTRMKKHCMNYIKLPEPGLQVKQKNDGIFISQDKYVAEIIKKFGFTEVKNASTLIETQKPLLKDEDGKEVDVHMYSFGVDASMDLKKNMLSV
nr:hypothetical protein [Tanacetum cinerariifolium]